MKYVAALLLTLGLTATAYAAGFGPVTGNPAVATVTGPSACLQFATGGGTLCSVLGICGPGYYFLPNISVATFTAAPGQPAPSVNAQGYGAVPMTPAGGTTYQGVYFHAGGALNVAAAGSYGTLSVQTSCNP